MKYCSKCGKQIEDEAVICIHCGCPTVNKPIVKDESSPGANVLGVLFPIVGLILYAAWKNETPRKASGVGTAALIGFVCSLALSILFYWI